MRDVFYISSGFDTVNSSEYISVTLILGLVVVCLRCASNDKWKHKAIFWLRQRQQRNVLYPATWDVSAGTSWRWLSRPSRAACQKQTDRQGIREDSKSVQDIGLTLIVAGGFFTKSVHLAATPCFRDGCSAHRKQT